MKSDTGIERLIRSYPRTRQPLTAAHQAVYKEQYRLNREGAGVVEGMAQGLERWMHSQVAAVPGGPVLELGAGTLNHLSFEPGNAVYDVVEPFVDLYRGRPETTRIREFFARVQDVPVERRYGRVISVAVLEHMTELPSEMARAALHLESDGVFQAGIPSEGGLLWWVGWRFSTGISYRLRTGLDYGVVMRHEHVNTASEIVCIARYLFDDVKVRRFPLPVHQLSFYAYLEARSPNRERCLGLAMT